MHRENLRWTVLLTAKSRQRPILRSVELRGGPDLKAPANQGSLSLDHATFGDEVNCGGGVDIDE